MNVQISTKAGGFKPGWKKRAEEQRKKDAKRIDDLIKAGCSCDLSLGYSSTDPRCPLHGLSEFRRDNDRR